jgi:hypothetical protein
VVGIVPQFNEVDQLPEPPPPVHVALPIGAAKDGVTPMQKACMHTIAAIERKRRIIGVEEFIRLKTAAEGACLWVFRSSFLLDRFRKAKSGVSRDYSN